MNKNKASKVYMYVSIKTEVLLAQHTFYTIFCTVWLRSAFITFCTKGCGRNQMLLGPNMRLTHKFSIYFISLDLFYNYLGCLGSIQPVLPSM